MQRLFYAVLFFAVTTSYSQNTIEWSEDYQLKLSDFQSTSTQVGNVSVYGLHIMAGMEFSFYMSNVEFAFTKNFNSKVSCNFQRSASYLVAPDSATANDLLNFARYAFDLSELYARKLRQKLHESKGTFSSVDFFRPHYDSLQQELNERHANAMKETDMGRERIKLTGIHQQVDKEILELPDFCKTCTPPKKKKKK